MPIFSNNAPSTRTARRSLTEEAITPIFSSGGSPARGALTSLIAPAQYDGGLGSTPIDVNLDLNPTCVNPTLAVLSYHVSRPDGHLISAKLALH